MHFPRYANAALAATSLILAPLVCGAQPKVPKQIQPDSGGKPQLEMVFVLDTTGSMGGLIEGAKQKIWSIVNDVMKTPSHPKVKIGLVAYRDHGDDYVTKVLPMTDDLDKVYATLMEYRADGGGDTPEDVRKALADGVRKAGWSPKGPHIAQILFLVGDAPPHNDYSNEPDTLASAGEAVNRGIIVNAIQCGAAEDTRLAWQQICRRGEGQYFQIAQDGGVQAITTPYDHELSKLGGRVGSTYLPYGGGTAAFRAAKTKGQKQMESSVAAAAPLAGQADRAINKAINRRAYDDSDLLQGIENGAVKLDAIKPQDLPNELKNLPTEARKKEIDKRIAERKALRAQIIELSKKREAFIAAERKKKGGAKSGFDSAVSSAIRVQASRQGIKF